MPAEIPFSELVDVNPRRPLKSGERYPYVEMAAVPEGGGRPTHHEEREFTGGGSRFAVGDILFARITPCTENGKLAYVNELPVGEVGFGSTELIVLAAKPGKADPRFVYQVAASARVRERAISRMLGTSGRQRVPTWYFTEELTIPDIPLPEQRAIAAVLDAVDDTIERTEAVIGATEELRRALLHELLTRGVPGMHSDWKHVPGLGTVPACWEVTTLGECSEVRTGRALNKSKLGTRVVPYLSVANVKDGYLDLSVVKSMAVQDDEATRYRLQLGDVLLTEGGDADKLGRGTIWRGEIEECLHQNHIFAVRPDRDRIEPEFLSAYTRSGSARRYFLGAAKQTTNLASLNSTQLRQLLVPLPSLDEQCQIVCAVSSLGANLACEQERLTATTAFKGALASALLSGGSRRRTEAEGVA